MYIIRQTVMGFYYYWNREEATWYGYVNAATKYNKKPFVMPPYNGDEIQFLPFNEAIK